MNTIALLCIWYVLACIAAAALSKGHSAAFAFWFIILAALGSCNYLTIILASLR